jgi:hypothetical protein
MLQGGIAGYCSGVWESSCLHGCTLSSSRFFPNSKNFRTYNHIILPYDFLGVFLFNDFRGKM